MSIQGQIAISGQCKLILKMIESAEKENISSEEILKIVKKHLKETKEACDIGWY